MFSSEYTKFLRKLFLTVLYRSPLVAASEFLTNFAKNNCKENHFSVEIFSEISFLSCNVFKDYSFTDFSQLFSFFKHHLYRTPLVAASQFLTKLAKNNCKEDHFSVEIFSEIS